MLHPHEYTRTCSLLFPGRDLVFEHVPVPRPSDIASYGDTLRMYEDYFGVRPNRSVWPRADALPAPLQPQRMIEITIRDAIMDRLSPVTISPTYTVAQLKVLVLNVDSVAIEAQHLVFGGRLLEDSKRLRDSRIRDKSIINLARRLVVCCARGNETSGERPSTTKVMSSKSV